MLTQIRKTWATRIQLGALLLVSGELIAWQNPLSYSPLDWVALFAIYIALAALLLDIMARWQTHDWQTIMLVAGFYGGLRTLTLDVLNITADNFTLQLILIPFGLQVLAFGVAFLAFRLFSSGESTGVIAFVMALVAGFLWGTWVRWSPNLENFHIPLADFDSSLSSTLLGLFWAGLVPFLIRPVAEMVDHDWRLTPYEGLVAGGVIFVTLVLRSSEGYIDTLGGGILGVLCAIILFILYFTRTLRRQNPFGKITPPQKPFVLGWLILGVAFIPAGWGGYYLADGASTTPAYANLILSGLFLFAVLWLPLVSIWLGIQIFTRLTREGY